MNILLDPVQQLALIQQANVHVAVSAHFRSGEKPQRPDAIVEIDQDDAGIGLNHEVRSVVVCIGIRHESAALDVHPDWKVRCWRRVGRGEHVDEQAVFCLVCGLGLS